MKKTAKIISALLVAVLAVSLVVSVNSANITFTDISGHWAWTGGQIPYLTEKDVLNGYAQGDGTYLFKPDKTITRAEFIKILTETAGLTETAPVDFKDVKDSDWYYIYFCKAKAQGFLINYGTNASPNMDIPREEAVALIARYLNLPANEAADESVFTDTNEISQYYVNDVLRAVSAGIINGYEQSDGTFMFKPKKTLSRAEALTIIYRAFGCIFNQTTHSRDASAYKTNNIITKSGITLNSVTLDGRNIVSEGAGRDTITIADSKINGTLYVRGDTAITLDNTTADEIVVSGSGKITLIGDSKIGKLTVEKTVDIALTKGEIDVLNVKGRAENVKVTGNGSIRSANIAAPGFISSMSPSEYFIANGITATFAATPHTGSSTTAESIDGTPYVTSDGENYFVHVTTKADGKLLLYFTNSTVVPAVDGFDSAYRNSQYSASFTVKAGKPESLETFPASQVSSYKYIIIQVQNGMTKYNPVKIDNKALSGYGFSKNPETSANLLSISFTPAVTGKIYWFYSDTCAPLNQSEFLVKFEEKENAMKDAIGANAGKADSVKVNSRYTQNYPYVYFMLENESGQRYTPIVVAVGDNGFSVAPIVTTPGTIGFTPAVSGTVYYYLSETPELPSPEDYMRIYRKAVYKDNKAAVAGAPDFIEVDKNKLSKYPYVIFAIKDTDDDVYIPVYVLARYYTGFKADPTLDINGVVTFTAAENGTVYYYITSVSVAPTSEDFVTNYNETAKAFKGSVGAQADKKGTITADKSLLTRYGYIVVMFVDSNGTNASPIVLKMANTEAGSVGYAERPKFYTTEEGSSYFSFKAASDGFMMYYFSNTDGRPGTAELFLAAYRACECEDKGQLFPSEGYKVERYVSPETVAAYDYLIIELCANENLEGYSSPVVINMKTLEEVGGGSTNPNTNPGYGFTSSKNGTMIIITPTVSGTLYHYGALSYEQLPEGNFTAAYETYKNATGSTAQVTKGTPVPLMYGSSVKYIVACIELEDHTYCKYAIIDMSSGRIISEQEVEHGYGFSITQIQQSNFASTSIFSFTALADGEMTVSVRTDSDTLLKSIPITAGNEYSIDLTAEVARLKNLSGLVASIKLVFKVVNDPIRYTEYTLAIR